MRRLLVAFFLLLSFVCSLSQKRDSLIIQNDTYRIVYSEILEQPLDIRYEVRCIKGTASRDGLSFYKEKTIHTSDDNDYENNVWDRGHCAPAANFSCEKNMFHKTFSYANCVLQHNKLNRGPWKMLESHERDLAKNGRITVEINVVFSKMSIKLQSGATVPDGFWKKIFRNGKLIECYYFSNDVPKEPSYVFYRMKCKK